jgi:hypothetical protein
MPATATFIIDFGSIEDAYLVAELDEVKNGGKTSFTKGDTVHFKVFSDVNYEFEVTSGTISNGSVGVQEIIENEILSFIKGEAPSVQNYIAPLDPPESAITSQTWYGNNLGAIKPFGGTNVQADNATEETIGIASIDYITQYNEHQLVPPSGMTDVYHIIVYIKAVA